MGLTVTEDTPADMLAGNMELLVQLPPRIDDQDYDNDDTYEVDDHDERHQHLRNSHRHHNHHHSNGHHTRRSVNGNARRVTVARNTPMMDLLVQVATSQKLSASSYTLEAIGEHGLVLTHHPNTPIGALDALQVKLLPKQGTFVPMKTRHANQPFETTFRLQVHLPRNQLYVSRVSSRMNLGKILDDVCREKNLDRNNYELRHPANIEEVLDLSLSLQDYHLQEVTLCPKRRSMGSSLSSQDIMALQRQEERRRQEAKQSVFGFAFKKSKESSLSTDSLGERSVSPARSDGTGRSSSPLQAPPTAPTRPQRKRRPAPKPPTPAQPVQETNAVSEASENIEKDIDKEDRVMISHSRNSSDSSGYHEASVLSDNLDSNIRVPETLPRRSKLQNSTPCRETTGSRTLAESSQASKSLGNLSAAIVPAPRTTIARVTSNSSLSSAGLRKKKAAPAPPQTRPLSSATSTQALERIVDSEESFTSAATTVVEEYDDQTKALSDVAIPAKRKFIVPRTIDVPMRNEETPEAKPKSDFNVEEKLDKRDEQIVEAPRQKDSDVSRIENSEFENDCESSISENEIVHVPKVENACENKHKRAIGVAAAYIAPVPKPRAAVVMSRLENVTPYTSHSKTAEQKSLVPSRKPAGGDLQAQKSTSNVNRVESTISKVDNDYEKCKVHELEISERDSLTVSNDSNDLSPRPIPRFKTVQKNQILCNGSHGGKTIETEKPADYETVQRDSAKPPKKPRRKTLEQSEVTEMKKEVEDVENSIREENEKMKDGETGVRSAGKTKESRQKDAVRSSDFTKAREIFKNEARTTAAQKKEDSVPRMNKQLLKAPVIFETGNEEVQSSINDVKRSCAVISTVPKCDHFESGVGTKKMITVSDDGSEYSLNSSLGSSFGAGKSILESAYQHDSKSSGTPSVITEFTNSEDELELDNIDMFERSRNASKILLRSHSELNNFEINTYEGNGRHVTSRSVDYTFALNPNLSRNISDLSTDSYPKKYTKKNLKNLKEPKTHGTNARTTSTELPAFLTNNITWERPEFLHGAEQRSQRTAWSLGESELGEEEGQSIITEAESISHSLKKVSDTLSGSLRSPATTTTTTTTAVASSLANEDQYNPSSVKTSNLECVNGDVGIGINEAQRSSAVDENLPNTNEESVNRGGKESSNFLNDSKESTMKKSEDPTAYLLSSNTQNTGYSDEENLSSTTTDWEYILPEPPTAFRDTNVVANAGDFISSNSNSEEKSTPIIAAEVARSNCKEKISDRSIIDETVKFKETKVVSNNSTIFTNNLQSNDEGLRPRTSSASFSHNYGTELVNEQRKLSRSVNKSNVDTESRRGSQAASTPSVAPVDNTLSNFVITTYSRPKNVDIFDEIDRTAREPQVVTSPKNSALNSKRSSIVNIADSRKNSTSSLHKDEEKCKSVTITQMQEIQKNFNETTVQEKSNEFSNNHVNRSNMKVSIATKPRPKSEIIINDNINRLKSLAGEDSQNSKEQIKPVEDTIKEAAHGGNQKFSQWRDDILKKQETPTKEKQLQSLQVLRSILPQLEGTRGANSDDKTIEIEKPNHDPSEEPRVEATISKSDATTPTEPNLKQTSPKVSTTSDNQTHVVKRYTYAGPPAIDLGSWSDRSRTTKVQIKPDSDYKFEKSSSPTTESVPAAKREAEILNKDNKVTVTLNNVKSEHSASTIRNQRINIPKIDKDVVDHGYKKESNEFNKNLISSRTNVTGFKRPVSMIVESCSGTMTSSLRSTKEDVKWNGERDKVEKEREKEKEKRKEDEEKEEEIDVRPRNFKELKEAFAKEQNTSNNSITIPKYGTYGRSPKSENSANLGQSTNYKSTTTIVRRDSNVANTVNGELQTSFENISRKDHTNVQENLNVRINNKPVVQDKRNFVVTAATATNNRNGIHDIVGTAVRRTSRGNLMPVVKGFKINAQDEEKILNQEKRTGTRIAIGDISNGNHNVIPTQNTLKKTVQVKVADDFSKQIPKPPPCTMPVITGVTLKSNNLKNTRPKSMPVEIDPRNQLLESIRNFGTENQLKRVPRKNPNIAGNTGTRSVRS